MADFQNTIDLLGEEAFIKAFVDRIITEFNDDVIATVGRSAFSGCSQLTSVNLPLATSVGDYAFQSCTKLTSVNLPSVTSISQYAFKKCSQLTSVNLPLATSAGSFTFDSCTKLTSIDLPLATSVGSYTFNGCSQLTYVILRAETVCTLNNTNAFKNTPFASGKAGGTLLVPRALVTKYPNATNWSSIFSGNTNNRVLALEDYTVDGTITGEIDWDKLNGGTT